MLPLENYRATGSSLHVVIGLRGSGLRVVIGLRGSGLHAVIWHRDRACTWLSCTCNMVILYGTRGFVVAILYGARGFVVVILYGARAPNMVFV